MNNDLDALGILRETDKSSLSHDYLRHYERVFGHLRQKEFTLLEIGIWRGGSAFVWEDYFEKAQIIGVDIRPECAEYAGGRREVEIGSQADAAFLNDIGQRRKPLVIIDDGSHLADHVILTFRTLFKHLRPGGYYIVEDVGFHAGRNAALYQGSSDVAPQEILLRLARMVSCPTTEGDDERSLAWEVDFVDFFPNAIAIRKREQKSPTAVDDRRELVERANLAMTWCQFGEYIWRNNHDLDETVKCIQRAMDMDPKRSSYPSVLAMILEAARDFEGAVKAAEHAARLDPADRQLQERAADLRIKARPA